MDKQLELDEKEQTKFLIQKFQKRGFEGLALEDVANALVLPDFSKQFSAMTGQDWFSKYKVKAIDRLSKAKFDIQWMTRKDGDLHGPLFVNCISGDLNKVRQYLKDCQDPNVKTVVDQQKKSPIHAAAEQGRAAVVELLIQNNFNPNVRDRSLKTPLHYAALHGQDAVADTLLRNGGDITAKDNLGRSSIHLASCGPSSILLQLFISTRPELVNDLDHKRRSPLHYCVWNSSQNQVDLLRTLLDFKANPNAMDDDYKTPLHYASEGGRSRAIPILLQRGGLQSMAIKDKNGKLPLELSANDRTREMIIIYSAAPMNHRPEDITWMDQAIQGSKPIVAKPFVQEEMEQSLSPPPTINKKVTIKSRAHPKQQMLSSPNKQNQTLDNLNSPDVVKIENTQKNENSWGPSQINSWIREKFFVIMKKVQESGIKANHHLKKPYIYTASWMEGINTMEELFDSLKDVPPGEACIRIFNILCPYDRALPMRSGIEELVDGFFGEQWFEVGSYTNQKKSEDVDKAKRQIQQEYVNRISELELSVQHGEKQQFDTDQELAKSKAQLEVTKKTLQDQEQKTSKLIESLNQQLKTKEGIGQGYKNDALKYQKQIKEIELELDVWKNTPQGPSEGDIQQYLDEIEVQKQTFAVEREKEKQLRFKSGQLFVKSINDAKEQANMMANQLSKQNAMLSDKQQNIAPPQQLLKSAPQMKGKEAQITAVDNTQEIENMQDDDAIILMFKSLQGNLPPMKQRMKNNDSDGDQKLNQQEFSAFLKDLKLSNQDILSLCRIAGFLNGKKLLGIDEWVEILRNRPKQREMWEQKLFNKLMDAFKSKNLTLEKAFGLLDTDNSGTITPVELKIGLKSLKIVLNQKDMNSLFCIFDGDISGSISLVEMKSTLDHYQDLRQQQGEVEDEFDDDRIVEVEEGESSYKEITPVDKPFEQQQTDKEWVIDEKDFKVLNGVVMIQLPKGTGFKMLNLKTIYVKVILRGAEKEATLQFPIFDADQDWKQAISLPIVNTLKENLCDTIVLQFYSSPDHLDEEDFLGDVHTSWKACFSKPGEWVINNQFNLTNKTFIKEEKIMKKIIGMVNIQIMYQSNQDGNLANMKSGSGEKDFIGSIVEDGVVEISLVQCITSDDNKVLKEPKFYCDLKLMSTSETEILGKLTANNDIYWGQKYLQDVKCLTNSAIPSISAKVYVKTPKNFLQKETKDFGEVLVNWQECIQHPGQYLSRKSFLLTKDSDHPQKLYLKVRYVPKSMFQSIVDFKANVSEKEKRKQLTEEDYQDGTLKILFVRAKNLRADDGDTSDPYVKVKIESRPKVIEINSKTIMKTLNPEWNEMQSVSCRVPKEAPYLPLEVEVIDKDTFGDDSLGTCKIDLTSCFEKPCTWAVNDYVKVNDVKFKAVTPDVYPKLYLSAYWVPKGQKDPNIKAKDIDQPAAFEADPNIVEGNIQIMIVHAKDLNAGKGVVPDPYVAVIFPGGKEQKTHNISSTVNPLWNQTLIQEIKVDKAAVVADTIPIKLIIKDHNILTDGVIGGVDIPWSACILKSGEWAVNNIFTVKDIGKNGGQGSLGSIYIQVKFMTKGMVDDGIPAPLVENLLDLLAGKNGLWAGTLNIFLSHCRDLVKADSGNDALSDPFVRFLVPNSKKTDTIVIKNTLNPSWKTIYPLKIQMPKDKPQFLNLEVYDDDMVGKDLIGKLSVDISKCFQSPSKWSYNELSSLTGDLNMQTKFNNPKDFGKVYMQIMYCQEGVESKDPPLPLTEDIDLILQQKAVENKLAIKGQLLIKVPLAVGLKAIDESTKSSFPYCKIIFPDGHTIETKHIKNTLDPIWDFSFTWNCNIVKEQYKPIRFIILDANFHIQETSIGQVDVDWLECFTNPTFWEVNKYIILQSGKQQEEDLGQIYVQMNFLLDGQKIIEGQKIPEATPQSIKKLKKLTDEDYQDGTLKIVIVRAKNLRAADDGNTSDPFVKIKIDSLPKPIKIKSQIIKKTLNPEWKEMQSILCKVPKEAPFPPLQVKIYDDDAIGKDSLGTCKIDLTSCFEKPCTWAVNDYVKVTDVKFKSVTPDIYPTLYISAYWVPKGLKDPNIKAKDIDQPAAFEPDPNIVEGNIQIMIVHAKDLDAGKGVVPDPFVAVIFPGGKEQKTHNISSTVNPLWNQTLIQEIKVDKAAVVADTIPIKLIIKDHNILTDGVIGGVDIPWSACILKPGEWAVNNIFTVKDIGKNGGQGSLGSIYIQVKFMVKGMVDDGIPAPLVENLLDLLAAKKGLWTGTLNIFLSHCRDLVKADSGNDALSDPFVTFLMPNSKKTDTIVIKNTLNPSWKTIYPLKIQMPKDKPQFLNLEVYDDDMVGKDLIGKLSIDLNKCFQSPSQWAYDEVTKLTFDPEMKKKFNTENFGFIYIQIMYCPEGVICKGPPTQLIEDIVLILKDQANKKLLEQQKAILNKPINNIIKGIIKVAIMQADKILLLADNGKSSNTLVVVQCDKHEMKTDAIKGPSPKWNVVTEPITVKYDKAQDAHPIILTLKYNPGSLHSNIFIGDIIISDLAIIFDKPGEWIKLNLPLGDSTKQSKTPITGTVSVQIGFIPDQQIDNLKVV